MSNEKFKGIALSKKLKIEELQKFQNMVIQHQKCLSKITDGKDYREALEKLIKDIKEKENKHLLSELIEDNKEICELLLQASIGNVLRKDIIEKIDILIDKIDKLMQDEACTAAQELLEGAQNFEEIIQKVSNLILNNK